VRRTAAPTVRLQTASVTVRDRAAETGQYLDRLCREEDGRVAPFGMVGRHDSLERGQRGAVGKGDEVVSLHGSHGANIAVDNDVVDLLGWLPLEHLSNRTARFLGETPSADSARGPDPPGNGRPNKYGGDPHCRGG